MIKQLFIKIQSKTNVFTFDKSTMKDLKTELFQFVEDRTSIHKLFFRLEYAGKSYRWLDSQEMIIEANSNLNFFANHNLKKVVINKKEDMYVEKSILKQSNLIESMNELVSDGIIEKDNNIVHLGDTDIVCKSVIDNWIMLSYYLMKTFGNDPNFHVKFSLQKPLPNNYLEKIIGEKSNSYLDNLELEQLKKLATFCDYMDISYLLEIVCAFIANKYVKNKKIEEIKSLNLI